MTDRSSLRRSAGGSGGGGAGDPGWTMTLDQGRAGQRDSARGRGRGQGEGPGASGTMQGPEQRRPRRRWKTRPGPSRPVAGPGGNSPEPVARSAAAGRPAQAAWVGGGRQRVAALQVHGGGTCMTPHGMGRTGPSNGPGGSRGNGCERKHEPPPLAGRTGRAAGRVLPVRQDSLLVVRTPSLSVLTPPVITHSLAGQASGRVREAAGLALYISAK